MNHERPGRTAAQAQQADSRQHGERIRALDGLRGIAALIVVINHCLLTVPSLAAGYQTPLAHPWTKSWWVTYTPLHVLWDGTEAVFVFFILSGFVLALPFTDRRRFDWRGYYPRRLIRLYLPCWAALVCALILADLIPRHRVAGGSWWLNAHAVAHPLSSVLSTATLLLRTGWLSPALWTLRWEVLFSLLLPLYLWAAGTYRRLWPVKAMIVLAVVFVGYAVNPVGAFLPMFGLGVLMAFERERLVGLGRRIGASPHARLAWWSTAIAAIVLVNAYWLIFASGGRLSPTSWPAAAGHTLGVIGAALVVILVITWQAARQAGESRPVQWLGVRSFSLYLIHEPIVVSVAFVLGGRPNLAVTLALAVPLALIAADLFYRFAERPSHRLSKVVGRVSART